METAKEIFTEVWKEWFGDEDNDQLNIALEHGYIFEAMERYKQVKVEPEVKVNFADIQKEFREKFVDEVMSVLSKLIINQLKSRS